VRAAIERRTPTPPQTAADNALARARAQTGEPLRLELEGQFARGGVLTARVRATVAFASLPVVGHFGTIELAGRASAPVDRYRAHRELAVSRCLRSRHGDERGGVLVAGLLLSLALMIVIGAGVDIGHAFIVRRELVSLADAAALTGSQALDLQALHQGRLALDPELARAAALQTLAGEPGLRGQAAANSADVQVEVQRRVPTILLRLVGVSTLTVGAHAIAAPREP
jgi:hypothetical protein